MSKVATCKTPVDGTEGLCMATSITTETLHSHLGLSVRVVTDMCMMCKATASFAVPAWVQAIGTARWLVCHRIRFPLHSVVLCFVAIGQIMPAIWRGRTFEHWCVGHINVINVKRRGEC